MIAELVNDYLKDCPEDIEEQMSVKLMISRSSVGAIIGKGGSNVKYVISIFFYGSVLD